MQFSINQFLGEGHAFSSLIAEPQENMVHAPRLCRSMRPSLEPIFSLRETHLTVGVAVVGH